MTPARAMGGTSIWPALPLAEWQPTYKTLHLWAQIVGKTRLALAPMTNHWWHTALYVTARGLGTSPMPSRGRVIEVDFDFLDEQLVIRSSDGEVREMPLAPRPVADFFGEYSSLLQSLDVDARTWPVPCEIENPIPFAEDRVHSSYDADAARRCWRVMLQVDRVLTQFRGRFVGKSSPVHFWWGGFDLACTRFSGRRAPPHPGGIPNTPDYVTREGYSHECISAGWWPGGGAVAEPAFYAYSYPAPVGLADAPVRPAAARYHPAMGEWILPYDVVRTAIDPDSALLDFLQSTYEAAAERGGWDRAALERAS